MGWKRTLFRSWQFVPGSACLGGHVVFRLKSPRASTIYLKRNGPVARAKEMRWQTPSTRVSRP